MNKLLHELGKPKNIEQFLMFALAVVGTVALLTYTFVHTGGLLAKYVEPPWVGYVAAFGIELIIALMSFKLARLRTNAKGRNGLIALLAGALLVSALANLSEGYETRFEQSLTLANIGEIDVIQAVIGVSATALLSLLVFAVAEILGDESRGLINLAQRTYGAYKPEDKGEDNLTPPNKGRISPYKGEDGAYKPRISPEDKGVSPYTGRINPEDETLRPEEGRISPEDGAYKGEDETLRPEDTPYKPRKGEDKGVNGAYKPLSDNLRPEDKGVSHEDRAYKGVNGTSKGVSKGLSYQEQIYALLDEAKAQGEDEPTQAEIARKVGCSATTASKWVNEYHEGSKE